MLYTVSFVFGLRFHSFPSDLGQYFPHPHNEITLHDCNRVRFFCPILHSILEFLEISVDMHIKSVRFKVCSLFSEAVRILTSAPWLLPTSAAPIRRLHPLLFLSTRPPLSPWQPVISLHFSAMPLLEPPIEGLM